PTATLRSLSHHGTLAAEAGPGPIAAPVGGTSWRRMTLAADSETDASPISARTGLVPAARRVTLAAGAGPGPIGASGGPPPRRKVTLVAKPETDKSPIAVRAGLRPDARRVTLATEAGQRLNVAMSRGPQLRPAQAGARLADRDRREPDRGARRHSARSAPCDTRGISRAGPEHDRGARRHSARCAPRDARGRSRIKYDRCVRGSPSWRRVTLEVPVESETDASPIATRADLVPAVRRVTLAAEAGPGPIAAQVTLAADSDRDGREPDRSAGRPRAGRAPRDARGRSRKEAHHAARRRLLGAQLRLAPNGDAEASANAGARLADRDRREPARGARRPRADRAPRDARGRSRSGPDRCAGRITLLTQKEPRGGVLPAKNSCRDEPGRGAACSNSTPRSMTLATGCSPQRTGSSTQSRRRPA
ncbi:hypothetical protein T492DRAFT_1074597, partial [Pavlovales sp. CCMP2436]